MFDRRNFDKWAGSYDDDIASGLNTFPFIGYYDLLAAMVSTADTRPGMRVLDVGIGTGLLSEVFASQGCAIHGVDCSEKMLQKARARIPDAELAVVDVARDYLGNFSDNRFDLIVSSYFIHHLDRDAQVSFIRRAVSDNLSPAGIILIADVGFEDQAGYKAAHEKYREVWDEEEFYLCGELILAQLNAEAIQAEYTQVSECAGVLRCAS